MKWVVVLFNLKEIDPSRGPSFAQLLMMREETCLARWNKLHRNQLIELTGIDNFILQDFVVCLADR